MYTFEFIKQEKDYLEFITYHNMNSPSTRKNVTIWGLVSLGISIVLFLLLEGIFAILICIPFILIGILMIFGKRIFIPEYMKAEMKRTKKEGKLPFGETVKARFDEEYLYQTSGSDELKMKYDNMDKVAEGNHAIYIYIDAVQAFILPDCVFENKQQKTEFLAFVKGKVPIK